MKPKLHRLPLPLNQLADLFPRSFLLVLLACFGIRIYAVAMTYIVNNDGVFYIHQARALFYGQFDQLSDCIVGYLSIYPFFIAGLYSLFGDWILSARTVSLVFGTAAIIPAFLILRRFFDERISSLAALLFGLIPMFVGRSADVVREPIYWLFLGIALHQFLLFLDNESSKALVFSSIFLMLAIWARIEGIFVFVTTAGFIIFAGGKKRIGKLLLFGSPVFFLVLLDLMVSLVTGSPFHGVYRGNEILPMLKLPLVQYAALRNSLTQLLHTQPLDYYLRLFLPEARNFIWLVAFGIFFNGLLSGFFFPAFVAGLLGVKGAWNASRSGREAAYLMVLFAAGLVFLYVTVFRIWVMYSRLVGTFVFPGLLFIGFGLHRLFQWLQGRFSLTPKTAAIILISVILAGSLPVDLTPREKDKAVFKEIGTTIAEREGNRKIVKIAASAPVLLRTAFYANLGYPAAVCPSDPQAALESFPNEIGPFIQKLHLQKIDYLLYDERSWPDGRFDLQQPEMQRHLMKIGTWSHPDTGRMILYEVQLN